MTHLFLCLVGIDGNDKLKKFENDWILGRKLCYWDHYDCVYSCEPKNNDLNGLYQVRIVVKDANIAPQMRAQMRLINQLYLDFININQKYGVFSVGNSLLLFDICENDDYFYFIEKKTDDGWYCFHIEFCESWSREMVVVLLQTVSIMHSFGIVHLGLNDQNVMVDDCVSSNIKIKNYGLGCMISKMMGESNYHYCSERYIDCKFVAPEVRNGQNNNSDNNYNMNPSSDIWSLGLLIFQHVYGQLPSNDLTAWLAKYKTSRINEARYKFPTHNINTQKEVSEKWAHLICQMIQKDPNDRITAMEALNHPALKGCCPCIYPLLSLFTCNTLNALSTTPKTTSMTSKTSTNGKKDNCSHPFSCRDLCKIYSFNADDEKMIQGDEIVCNLTSVKLASNESNVTAMDVLIISMMMHTFQPDIVQLQSILLKSIFRFFRKKVSLFGTDVVGERGKITIVAFIFAICNNCLDCNGKNFQELKQVSQWKIFMNLCFAILENNRLIKTMHYKRKQKKKSEKLENKYRLSIDLDDNLNIKNFENLIRDAPKMFACGAWGTFLKFLCPHLQHAIYDTLQWVLTYRFSDYGHYATLVMSRLEQVALLVTFEQQDDHKQMQTSGETPNWLLQTSVSIGSHTSVQKIYRLYSNIEIYRLYSNIEIIETLLKKAIVVDSEMFNCLLTTLFKDDETKMEHFTFLYELFTFAVMKNKKESQDILSTWLEKARKHSLNKHYNNHTIENIDHGKVHECICIECLQTGKNVEYCTKCNFFLCQACANYNQVMLFCCLYPFLLNIYKLWFVIFVKLYIPGQPNL